MHFLCMRSLQGSSFDAVFAYAQPPGGAASMQFLRMRSLQGEQLQYIF